MDALPHPDPPPEMVGVCPPEHDVRGRTLMVLVYGIAGLLWVWVVSEDTVALGEWIPRALLASFFFLPAILVAEALRRFECWAWFFLMPWLAGTFLLTLGAATDPMASPTWRDRAEHLLLGAVLLPWIHYLWVRRWEFWHDERLEARREVPRYVTPEWRAARLARMRSLPRANVVSDRCTVRT